MDIRNRVYNSSENVPHAYVYMCAADINDPTDFGRSVLLHRVAKFPVYMGQAPTPWSDRPFAFYGDRVLNSIATVHWPMNTFHQVGPANLVPSIQLMDLMYNQDPVLQMLGPLQVQDAGVEYVQTRNAMYVPFRYVNLLLSHRLTPRQLWIQVAGAIRNNHDEAACRPLIDWIRVACTRPKTSARH